MNGSDVGARVHADVKVSASKSQALPIAFAILAGVSLLATFFFLWFKPERQWIPLLLTLGFGAAACKLWEKSHKNSDFDGGSPTEIIDANSGLTVTTDSRLLESPKAMQQLAQLVTQIAHRQELPDPDGIVDALGNPQPNTKDIAKERVDQANQLAKNVVDHMYKQFTPTTDSLSEPLAPAVQGEAKQIERYVAEQMLRQK